MNILKLLTVPALFCLFSTGCLNPVEEPQMGEPKGQSSSSEVVGIKGRVLDGNGNPIEGAAVSLRKSNFLLDPVTKQVPPNSDKLTDNASLFHFDKVDTGEYILTVQQDSSAGSSLPISISNTDSLVQLTVQLEPLGSLTGGITVTGSLRNLMPKYAQLFGTDYFAELISRKARTLDRGDGFVNYSDFFIPNIPKGVYRFQLSDDGINNCLVLPSGFEYVVEPGEVSMAWDIVLTMGILLQGRTQTTNLKEADTTRIYTEDFPIDIRLSLHLLTLGPHGKRHNGNLDTRQMWFKSVKWLHQGRVLTESLNEHDFYIRLEAGDVSSETPDSVVLQLENWGGTVTRHAFYLKAGGQKWLDEPYPELLDSVVAHYLNTGSGIVYGLPIPAPGNSPLHTVERFWRQKVSANSNSGWPPDPYLKPILARMEPEQKAAVEVFFDFKLTDSQAQDMLKKDMVGNCPIDFYRDSLSQNYWQILNSLIPGKLSDQQVGIGSCNRYSIATNVGVLTKSEIMTLLNQDFISHINLQMVQEKPIIVERPCSDSVKYALVEKGIEVSLNTLPYGIIYYNISQINFQAKELGALVQCTMPVGRLALDSVIPKIGPTLTLLMEKMGESDSILVYVYAEFYEENRPEIKELSRPLDENDSLAWAIYRKATDSLLVEYNEALKAYEQNFDREWIQLINQKLGRDVSKCTYFNSSAPMGGKGIEAVLLKHEINLLANDAAINSITFPTLTPFYPIRRDLFGLPGG